VVSGRLTLPNWDHAVEQWIARLNLLSQSCPDLQLPPIGAEDRRHVIEQICLGSIGYKDLKDKPVKPAVQSWLSPAQRELLDKYAPERITLSNGRTPRVIYEPAAAPFISMRIQELFGVTEIPKIAMGRVALNVHILAPSMRPVQVTRDLANFWREHYPKIKSELQRKYPRHRWL
jgi:ATP-dependent helicase HrpB